tara:strand:- start:2106 stop:2432 length:327 start_codon:yes stop_codon:yes gene_type:complete
MSKIEFSKLKRNTIIIVETDNSVFEIVVTGPKGGSVSITGGKSFIRPTKATFMGSIKDGKILEDKIEKNSRMKFFAKRTSKEKTVITSNVITATVYAPDKSWKYDVIE